MFGNWTFYWRMSLNIINDLYLKSIMFIRQKQSRDIKEYFVFKINIFIFHGDE